MVLVRAKLSLGELLQLEFKLLPLQQLAVAVSGVTPALANPSPFGTFYCPMGAGRPTLLYQMQRPQRSKMR